MAQVKLKAFTIVETLVALTLIGVTVGLCLLVFNQVAIDQYDKNELGLIADQLLYEMKTGKLETMDQEIEELPEEVVRKGIRVFVETNNYQENEHLFLVSIQMLKEENLLYEKKEVIVIEDEG